MTTNDLTFDDDFMATMLGEFLDESQGYLGTLNDNLLLLDELVRSNEGTSHIEVDLDILNEMFRAAHSMKGLSAMLQFHDINALTHKLENVFDAARHEELPISGEVVDLMFQAIDRLACMVDKLRSPDSEDVEFRSIVEDIQELLKLGSLNEGEKHPAPRPSLEIDPVRSVLDSSRSATKVERQELASDSSHDTESAAPVSVIVESVESVESVDHFADLRDETNMEDKYFSLFISDAEEVLDGLVEKIQAHIGSSDLNSIMIVAHRFKGAAATVGLNRPAKLAHCMEDLMQEMLGQQAELTDSLAAVLIEAADLLREYVDHLKVGEIAELEFNRVYCQLLSALGQLDAAHVIDTTPALDTSTHREPSTLPDSPSATAPCYLDAAAQKRISVQAPAATACLAGQIVLSPSLPLLDLKIDQLRNRLESCGSLFFWESQQDAAPNVAFLFGLAGTEEISTIESELCLDGVESSRVISLTPTELAPEPATTTSSTKMAPAAAITPPTTTNTTSQVSDPESSVNSDDTAGSSSNDANKNKNKPTETLRVDIDRLDQLMNLAGQLVINKARFGQIGQQLKGLAASKHSSHVLTGVDFLLDKMISDVEHNRPDKNCVSIVETLKGHIQQVRDDLQIVRRDIDHLSKARTLVNDLAEATHQLERVADGIQKSVMDTRMVPVGPLFSRFKRVIRDITRVNGRDVRLVIRGENTELDKRMIDELADPLIHMVRNSADHGIELPDERQRAGKPTQGTITLDAFHRGNRVFVQIADDGRGLDVEKIRAKAISKGIISSADAERLTRSQVYQLIWEPGFSTAEKVTEVSGRGMGMDIVRSKIENINGTVELDSTPGAGTTITIKLPLTLAILPSLLTDIGGDVYSIPVESVIEIVSVPQRDLATVHGMATARIRGRVVSVVELADLFAWHSAAPPRTTQRGDCTLVIVGTDGNEMGLVVDNLLGEQDIVIKSLAENYRNVAGIAGASILGNGRVSLILDVVAMLTMAQDVSRLRDAKQFRGAAIENSEQLKAKSVPATSA
jgi:two-component system chemotaxis sensor kinase CheA